MNRQFYHILLKLFLFLSLLSSQIRYLDPIFNDVLKTDDVIYGNAPDLPFVFLFEWNTVDVDLKMDIYEPVGDNLDQRPVIIFIHPGAFFTGNNEVDDMVELSNQSAKRGFVSVSLSYRLGLNVLSEYSGERAVYRGVQDLNAAVRYLREYHDEYKINPDKIFVWGSSAGSFIALHSNFMQEEERPESTYGGFGDPDLGCINCEGNSFEQSSSINAVISCWGAIGDLNWINESDNTPIIMFHGTDDGVVPFDIGYPFTLNIFLPYVYGSSPLFSRLNDLGIESTLVFENGEGHEYWGTSNGTWTDGPNNFFESIINNSYAFLFDVIYPFLVGDINNDGEITNNDYIALLPIIMNQNWDENILYYSDLDYDGYVSIMDLIILLDQL